MIYNCTLSILALTRFTIEGIQLIGLDLLKLPSRWLEATFDGKILKLEPSENSDRVEWTGINFDEGKIFNGIEGRFCMNMISYNDPS
jgi:hypothetical protein